MEVSVLNINGENTGRKVTLDESIFGIEPNEHVVYLAVRQYLANQRQGTHKSKERSEISGSTRKLGRQKGGGGARTENPASKCRNRIRQKDSSQSGNGTIVLHQRRIDYCAADRADRVEKVRKEEGKTDHSKVDRQQKRKSGSTGIFARPRRNVKRGAEKIAKSVQQCRKRFQTELRQQRIISVCRIYLIEPDKLADHAEQPGAEHPEKQRAHYIAVHQISANQKPRKRQNRRDPGSVKFRPEEILNRYKCNRMILNDMRALECNQGNE